MGFLENIFPLIFIYLVWKVFSKVQGIGRQEEEQTPEPQPQPVSAHSGEPVQVDVRELLRQIFLGREESPPPRPRQAQKETVVPRKASLVLEGAPSKSTRREKSGQREKEKNVVPERSRTRDRQRQAGAPLAGGPCFSPGRLRQAVIWSEVLARPVALRDEAQGGMSSLP